MLTGENLCLLFTLMLNIVLKLFLKHTLMMYIHICSIPFRFVFLSLKYTYERSHELV